MWQRFDCRGMDCQIRVKEIRQVDSVGFRHKAHHFSVAIEPPRETLFRKFQCLRSVLINEFIMYPASQVFVGNIGSHISIVFYSHNRNWGISLNPPYNTALANIL